MPHDLHPIGTTYQQVFLADPKQVDRRPHLLTFRVVGHKIVKGIDGVVEVVEAVEKRTLTLMGDSYE